jgi:Domain of unknown function (DUF389)
MTFILHQLQLRPKELLPGQSAFLQGLSTINISTSLVAFAAGVARILALETRASSAVGVAISVTTIPASAYLGVAASVGGAAKALGPLAVLGVNIVLLLVGGSLTLIAQRDLRRHEARTAHPWGPPGKMKAALSASAPPHRVHSVQSARSVSTASACRNRTPRGVGGGGVRRP